MPGLDRRSLEVLRCSYYRDAELRGANLLFRLLRRVEDPEAQILLSQHLADETRHAWLWTKRIQEMGAAPVPVDDGYQVRIGKLAGLPRHVVDLFALTVVVEQRALREYVQHMKQPDVDPDTRAVLEAVTRDEGWHIDWIRKKARELAEAAGEPDRMERALERFREIDARVMEDLRAKEAELRQLAS